MAAVESKGDTVQTVPMARSTAVAWRAIKKWSRSSMDLKTGAWATDATSVKPT